MWAMQLTGILIFYIVIHGKYLNLPFFLTWDCTCKKQQISNNHVQMIPLDCGTTNLYCVANTRILYLSCVILAIAYSIAPAAIVAFGIPIT